MPKFQSASGGHVSIYVGWQPEPLELHEGVVADIDDSRVVKAFRASPEVAEVKDPPKTIGKA